MVEEQSLRSKTTAGNLSSAEWMWRARLRSLSLPTVDAKASRTKIYSDTDTGVTSTNYANQLSLTGSQPFLTGAQLSVTSNWTKSDTETETEGINQSTTSRTRLKPTLTTSFTQPLFLFTRNGSLRSRREANLAWADEQDAYRMEILQIQLDARALYYSLLLQRATRDIEANKRASAALVNTVTRAMVQAGKLPRVELARANLREQRDFRRIQNAESAYDKTLNEAKQLIGLEPSVQVKLTSILRYEPLDVSVEQLLELARQHNASLISAKRSIELSTLALQRTREGNLPTMNAVGSYSLTRDRSTDRINPYSWTAGIDITFPLLDASQTRLSTRQSQIALENANRNYENTWRNLQVGLQNNYTDIKRIEMQIGEFQPQRESAQSNVEAVRLQYQAGTVRLTDVFDAENELRDLELEYLGLLVDFNTSRDRLKLLVGYDWEAKQ